MKQVVVVSFNMGEYYGAGNTGNPAGGKPPVRTSGNQFFDNKREGNLREKLAEERKKKFEYAKKVGQLTMQVDWLKKKSEEIVGPDYESKFSPKPFDD